MEWYTTLIMILALLAALLAFGLPVAFAFFAVNTIFAYIFMGGDVGITQFVRASVGSVSNFSLTPIPLFVLMGELMFQTGMASRAIDAVDRMISGVPGRLSVVAVTSGTVFSALTGSSLATVAMLGSSLVPEMTKRGYKASMSAGPILATGGLAAMIPPSGLAVILGSLAGISVSGLLLGGVIPGLIMAATFIGYIVIRAVLQPSSAPSYTMAPSTVRERIRPFVVYVLPLFSVFVIVIGGMLSGIATITEVSALGVVATVALALAYRCLTMDSFRRSMLSTTSVTVMIFAIIAGSTTFSQVLAMSGATNSMLTLLTSFDLSQMQFVLLYLGIVLVLGCFIDPIAILMLTLPFFLPLSKILGVDMVWFGILLMIALELGFITPPFGLSIFVLKGIAPPSITTLNIYAAVLPFVVLQVLAIVLLILWPDLVTFLPDLLKK